MHTLIEQDERVRLQVIEGRIESNLRKMGSLWKSILEDLAEIEAQNLWRFSHDSFHDYWADRFRRTVLVELFSSDGAQKTYNYYRAKAIEAAVEVLPAGIEFVPINEGQARELTGLPSAEAKQMAAKVAHDLCDTPTAQHYARGAASTVYADDEFQVGDRVYSTNAKSPHFGMAFDVQETGVGRSETLVMATPEKGGSAIPFAKGELGYQPPINELSTSSTIVESSPKLSPLPDRLSYCNAQLIATQNWLIKMMTSCSLVLMTENDSVAHRDALDEMRDRLQKASKWLGVDVAA